MSTTLPKIIGYSYRIPPVAPVLPTLTLHGDHRGSHGFTPFLKKGTHKPRRGRRDIGPAEHGNTPFGGHSYDSPGESRVAGGGNAPGHGGGDVGQRPINAYESCRRVPNSSGLNGVTASALYSRCDSYPTVNFATPTPTQGALGNEGALTGGTVDMYL